MPTKSLGSYLGAETVKAGVALDAKPPAVKIDTGVRQDAPEPAISGAGDVDGDSDRSGELEPA
jgi:hypothetical protein